MKVNIMFCSNIGYVLIFLIDVQVEPVLFPHSATALTVIKDIVTRWNSTYYMLERCIKLKHFIKEVCKEFLY